MSDDTKTPEQKLLDRVVKRLKQATKADDHNRVAGVEDLKFVNGEQWAPAEKKRRSDKGRPALQINLLPKFVNQVKGDMLHNTPSIKLRPIDSKGDRNIAIIRQGIINQIEYQSNAKGIYTYAGGQMVASGYGAWRVLTQYTEENPFLQEIFLRGIRNPFLVYMDPTAQDQNYADAKWGMLLERMALDEFEDRYPDAKKPSDEFKYGRGLADENWYDTETVTVAEYFEKTSETITMCQLKDGRVVSEDEFKELHKDWKKKWKELLAEIENPEITEIPPQPQAALQGQPQPAPQQPQGQQPQLVPQQPVPQASQPQGPQALDKIKEEPVVAKKRKTERTIIKQWVLTCLEVLEGGDDGDTVAGRYIPLVLLKGPELNIEGKNYVYSLVRHAKDPQKLINFWNSAAAETIALAPKAPWLGTGKQFEGYETDYAAANIDNMPVLKYNVDPEAPGPPQRQQPMNPPTAIFEQIRRGEDNLKSVIGMFNADVGAPTSAQTGAAVTAGQKPGDIGTFEYSENLARAIMHTGRIINEMIPEIYDSERDVRIRNVDESESFVPINTTVGDAKKAIEANPEQYAGIDQVKLRDLFAKEGKDAKFNDITVGKYDVMVTTGPSYATQRQESAQQLLQLTQAMPQQMAIAADLIVENMDFKGADELAVRLRKQLPQNLVKPRAGEAPAVPPPPPPQVQLQMAKVETEKAKALNLQAKSQIEQAKAQKEMGQQPQGAEGKDPVEAQLTQMRLQMEQMKLQHEQQKQQMDAQLEKQRADLETSRLRFELERQSLAIQQQREAHQAKLETIELQNEKTRTEIRTKTAPKKRQTSEAV